MLINFALTKTHTSEKSFLSFLANWGSLEDKQDEYDLSVKLLSDNKNELDKLINSIKKTGAYNHFNIKSQELDASHNTQYLCALSCKLKCTNQQNPFDIGEQIKKQLGVDVTSEQKRAHDFKHLMVIDLANERYDINDIAAAICYGVLMTLNGHSIPLRR